MSTNRIKAFMAAVIGEIGGLSVGTPTAMVAKVEEIKKYVWAHLPDNCDASFSGFDLNQIICNLDGTPTRDTQLENDAKSEGHSTFLKVFLPFAIIAPFAAVGLYLYFQRKCNPGPAAITEAEAILLNENPPESPKSKTQRFIEWCCPKNNWVTRAGTLYGPHIQLAIKNTDELNLSSQPASPSSGPR